MQYKDKQKVRADSVDLDAAVLVAHKSLIFLAQEPRHACHAPDK